MTPYFHARSTAKKWGGDYEDYMEIHDWFDETKQYTGDFTHRALRHHAAGVQWAIEKFGDTIKNSLGDAVPVKMIAEQHVTEDCGFVPTVQDWLKGLKERPADWMLKVQKKSTSDLAVNVGDGSEWMEVGLAKYPKHVEHEYDPRDDARFQKSIGFDRFFDRAKWLRHLSRKGIIKYTGRRYGSPQYDGALGEFGPKTDTEKYKETRQIRTGFSGWTLGGFCKTQYASNPECGGIPNFLRCHIGVITALDRFAALPTVKVDINDEGHYARANYSDDWQEAREAGREPTYVWHDGEYDPASLVKNVGESNEMMAAFMGVMKDALGGSEMSVESPIAGFQNFEGLEHAGRLKSAEQGTDEFLKAMAGLAETPAEGSNAKHGIAS